MASGLIPYTMALPATAPKTSDDTYLAAGKEAQGDGGIQVGAANVTYTLG